VKHECTVNSGILLKLGLRRCGRTEMSNIVENKTKHQDSSWQGKLSKKPERKSRISVACREDSGGLSMDAPELVDGLYTRHDAYPPIIVAVLSSRQTVQLAQDDFPRE